MIRPETAREALRDHVLPCYGPGDPGDTLDEWTACVRVYLPDATDEQIDDAVRDAVRDGLMRWDADEAVYKRAFDDPQASGLGMTLEEAVAAYPEAAKALWSVGRSHQETGPCAVGGVRGHFIASDDATNLGAILGRLLDAVEAGKAPDKVAVIIARNFVNAIVESTK